MGMTTRPRAADVWSRVSALRVALADRVAAMDDLQLDAASWCEGWRVREVVGHLVHLAEATSSTMARDIVTHGVLPNRALDRLARQTATAPGAELASRLRAAAGGRFHVPGTPPAVALGEIVVHSEDALRPIGQTLAPPPDDAVMVLDFYRRIARFAFRAKLPSHVRLVADDATWAAGSGPEVRGRALDLLLLLANRAPARDALHGAGVAELG